MAAGVFLNGHSGLRVELALGYHRIVALRGNRRYERSVGTMPLL